MQADGAPSRTRRRRRRRGLRPGAALDALSWLVPPAAALRLGDGLAGVAAGAVQTVARPFLPDAIRDYPRRVGVLFDEAVSPAGARRLVRERLAFLLTRQYASHALVTEGARRRLWERIEIPGLEHLEAARALGQGVMLVTTHFGLPFLIRVALPGLGIRQVQAKLDEGRKGPNVPVRGDAWERVAALKRFRAALAGGAACVLLVDGRIGAPVRMPFFASETTVTLGAFYLGYAARCPILPYFGLAPDPRGRLRLEISPPLPAPKDPSPEDLTEVAEAFFNVYRAYARRYPSHLPHRLVRGAPDVTPASSR
jgi:hypothetical protein